MHKRNRISGLVITYNEEQNIEKCLGSISFADEIIVVDSRSKDRTVILAKKYTENIFFRQFQGNFSDQRNYAINQAHFDWILFLDADEEMPENSEGKIKELISDENIDGYWFPRRNYTDKDNYLKYGYFYPDFQLRLFRNTKEIKYAGAIHEQPVIPKLKTKKIKNIEIYHNCSHTKYDSIRSIKRLIPYIKIEGKIKAASGQSVISLINESLAAWIKHTYRSFIKKKGYKDGYIGLRAAMLHGIYQSLISLNALFQKLGTKNA